MSSRRRWWARALWCISHIVACKHEGAPAPAASASAATSPGARSCREPGDCGAEAYCAFDPPLCGRGSRPGICKPRPQSCSSKKNPVCACDGKVYDDDCSANRAGSDRSLLERCEGQPRDFMRCGDHYCDAKTSYCEIYLSDVLEPPPDYECKPLPRACLPNPANPPSCDCFPADTPCLSFCGPLVTGGLPGFHLTCQGKRKPRAQ